MDALAPLYPMMRTAATAAMRKAPPEHAVSQLLQPLAAVLGSAVSEAVAAAARLHNWAAAAAQGAGGVAAAALPHKQRLNRQLLAPAAAGVMALGGLLEGLLRNAPGFEGVQSLAGEAEGLLRRASESAAAWVLNGEGDGHTSMHIDSPASSAGNVLQPQLLPGGAAGGQSSSGGNGGVAGSSGGQEGANWGLTAAGVKLLRDSCSLSTVQAFQVGAPALQAYVQLLAWQGELTGMTGADGGVGRLKLTGGAGQCGLRLSLAVARLGFRAQGFAGLIRAQAKTCTYQMATVPGGGERRRAWDSALG